MLITLKLECDKQFGIVSVKFQAPEPQGAIVVHMVKRKENIQEPLHQLFTARTSIANGPSGPRFLACSHTLPLPLLF
jgi:hypothetical protein